MQSSSHGDCSLHDVNNLDYGQTNKPHKQTEHIKKKKMLRGEKRVNGERAAAEDEHEIKTICSLKLRVHENSTQKQRPGVLHVGLCLQG